MNDISIYKLTFLVLYYVLIVVLYFDLQPFLVELKVLSRIFYHKLQAKK